MKCLKTKFVIVLTLAAVLSGTVYGYPQDMRSETLKGPWELSVQIQHGTEGASYPITVENESKPGKLESSLPIIGKPIIVKFQEYLPDLQWETNIVDKDNGGIVTEMHIIGNGLDQKLFLDSQDDKKRSMSASGIGGLGTRKLYNKDLIKKIADGIADPKVLGIVSVWPNGSDKPVEFLATESGTFKVPSTKYNVTIEQYIPHYSIDTNTRQVISVSDKAINPAIKIKTDIDGEIIEQWLWSKYPSYPHSGGELPFRIEYSAFTPGEEGDYLLAGAKDSQMYMFYLKDGKTVAEKAEIDKQYFFKDETYSFSLTTIRTQAAIETKWVNKSESLNNPAIIASILQNGRQQQAILELNKPYNYQTESEAMIFTFRKKEGGEKMEHLSN